MNRIAIIGLFTALDELIKEGNIKAIDRIVNAVLEEARSKKGDRPTKNKEE